MAKLGGRNGRLPNEGDGYGPGKGQTRVSGALESDGLRQKGGGAVTDLPVNSLPVDSEKVMVRLPLPIYTVVPVVDPVNGWVQVQVAERSRSRHMVMEMSPSKVV